MNFSEFKNRFSASSASVKLIYINIIVFVVVAFLKVFVELFGGTSAANIFINKLQLPSDKVFFFHQVWSIFTYMFLHLELFHIFFNLLCLYWFGKFFLHHFTDKQMFGVYVLGGLVGGLLYILSYAYIPFFAGKTGLLCGASASIMAIITSSAVDNPNVSIRFFLLGSVKLKWVAITAILFSVLGLTSDNAGGEISHIGGALAGWMWVVLLRKGVDITTPVEKIINFFTNLFDRIFNNKSKSEIKNNERYHYVKSDEEYNMERTQNSKKLDAILDKIRKSGYTSLTEKEKQELFDASNKL